MNVRVIDPRDFLASRIHWGPPEWDIYFLSVAQVIALRSDSLQQEGAVVTRDRHIVSTGYKSRTAHAGVYALGRYDCRGADLYLTDRPCGECMRLAQRAGIARMIWIGEKDDLEEPAA